MDRVKISIAVVVVAAVSLGAWWHFASSGVGKAQPPEVSAKNVFSSFDSFNDELAQRVSFRITGSDKPMDDFHVVAVTGAAYPVGTLLRLSPLIPVTASACLPHAGDGELMSNSAPTLFPMYALTHRVAASFGLDSAVLEGIASAGLNAAQDSSVNLSITEATLDLWTDQGLKAALSAESCRKVLEPGTTYRLVRGLVKGKREFAFGVNRTGTADVKVPNIASFKAEVGGTGSTMKISDVKSETFVMVVSDVTLPANAASAVKVAAPSAAPAAAEGRRIFIQEDAADKSERSRRLVELLRKADLNVVDPIERLPTDRMPLAAQVRYFRQEDESEAERVLELLKTRHPHARLVAMRIPSPKGQLEVWLPRKVPSGT